MKKWTILLVLQGLFFAAKAQNVKVFGYVKDSLSGETLLGANIYAPTEGVGVASNNFGFYTLEVPRNKLLHLKTSFVGYKTSDRYVSFQKDTLLNILLANETLEEVEIKAEKQEIIRHGEITMPIERLKAIPSLGGEPDIIKALTFLPGIAAGVEGTTGLYVRGGTPDQNLILLDGGKVYNTSHLFGFISVFNPAAIKSLSVYKGGFPARYGGRLSSIIDITMKEGNNQKRESELSFGLINSSFMTEGPIQKGKSSYMISGRSAYSSLFSLLAKGSENYKGFFIYDVNAKMNFDLSTNQKLFLSCYLGKDIFESKDKGNLNNTLNEGTAKWGNETVSLRYTNILRPNLFASVLLNYNNFNYTTEGTSTDIVSQQRTYDYSKISKVREFSTKVNFDLSLGKQSFKFGTEVTKHRFEPNSLQLTNYKGASKNQLNNQLSVYNPTSVALFGEYIIPFSQKINMNVGARWLNYFIDSKQFSNFEPRLLLSYEANKSNTFEGSITRMGQNLHLLTTSTVGLPNDIWTPATNLAPLERAWQASVSYTKKFKNSGWSLQLESFYKKMDGLIDFKNGVNIFSFDPNSNWEQIIEKNGIGRAYGFEFFLKKDAERWNGWISYTLAWSERKFDNINKGSWYPQHYDRRHNLEIVSQYKISDSWTFNANFVLQTGYAFNLPDVIYEDIYGTRQAYYTSRNNARTPVYHRLDVGFSKEYTTRNGNEAKWTFSIYNAYAHANPFAISYSIGAYDDTSLNNGYKGTTQQTSIFNFIPGLNWSLKF